MLCNKLLPDNGKKISFRINYSITMSNCSEILAEYKIYVNVYEYQILNSTFETVESCLIEALPLYNHKLQS